MFNEARSVTKIKRWVLKHSYLQFGEGCIMNIVKVFSKGDLRDDWPKNPGVPQERAGFREVDSLEAKVTLLQLRKCVYILPRKYLHRLVVQEKMVTGKWRVVLRSGLFKSRVMRFTDG